MRKLAQEASPWGRKARWSIDGRAGEASLNHLSLNRIWKAEIGKLSPKQVLDLQSFTTQLFDKCPTTDLKNFTIHLRLFHTLFCSPNDHLGNSKYLYCLQELFGSVTTALRTQMAAIVAGYASSDSSVYEAVLAFDSLTLSLATTFDNLGYFPLGNQIASLRETLRVKIAFVISAYDKKRPSFDLDAVPPD